MGIIARFKEIMAANINAALDKCEDPSKMIDQYLRDLESDFGKVKAETAAIMAEETRAKRELDECQAEITKLEGYARKAVEADNDDDARQFLTKKANMQKELDAKKQAFDLASANAQKMRQMHDKLQKDIESLESRKEAIKAKVQVAKTQEKINKMGSSIDGARGTIDAFDRMEKKADQMLDRANAMSELNESEKADSVKELQEKYDNVPDQSVEDELAALKASMGK